MTDTKMPATDTAALPSLKVRDLLAILADCDPDAPVLLYLPAFFDENDKTVMADDDPLGMSYCYVPEVGANYTTSKEVPWESLFDEQGQPRPGVKPNSVTIELSEASREGLLKNRKQAIEDDDPNAGMEPEPVVGDAETVIVDVAMPRTLHATIRTLLHGMNTSHQVREEQACTHGPLTVSGLLGMLAEDVGMVETRPGCWEASNMEQVLASHGYNS